MAAPSLKARLVRGELILLDGALGTELERRGVPTPLPLWSAEAVLDAPDSVRAVHVDHARAGADVLTAATFRTTPRALRRAGRGAAPAEREAETLTERAVALAREGAARGARGRALLIAGAIAPLEDCYRPDLVPDDSVCRAEHAAQAQRLKRAGADFLLVETMGTVREAEAAVVGARATGLPVFVSFTVRGDGALLGGEPLAEAVRALAGQEPDAVLVNCAPVRLMPRCLDALRAHFAGPVGCYPNLGAPDVARGAWRFDDATTPAALAEEARGWLAHGAQVVGGCCGTSPEHIRALRRALPPVLVE